MTTSRPLDFFLQWHLTERCNLACRHCYQGQSAGEELSLAEARLVIAEVVATLRLWSEAYGVAFEPSFNLTGGEPLLRSDLFEVLAALDLEGFNVFLLTNGTLVNRPAARRLSELGVRGVQVSIEGPPEIHDAIRGRGSFAAAMAGVEALLAAGLPVTLNATLSRENAAAMPALAEVAAAAGVPRLGFARLVPCGRGEAMLAAMLSAPETRMLYEQLLALRLPHLEIVTGDPVAAQLGVEKPPRPGGFPLGGCAAGVSGVTILPDGTLLPCRRLPIPLGNLRRDSLREIWASSEMLRALRDRSRYGGRCGSCPRWAGCRGCRAVAWAASGDYLAEDPQCFIAQ